MSAYGTKPSTYQYEQAAQRAIEAFKAACNKAGAELQYQHALAGMGDGVYFARFHTKEIGKSLGVVETTFNAYRRAVCQGYLDAQADGDA